MSINSEKFNEWYDMNSSDMMSKFIKEHKINNDQVDTVNQMDVRRFAYAKHYPHRGDETTKQQPATKQQFTTKQIPQTQTVQSGDTKQQPEERKVVKLDDTFYIETKRSELSKKQLIKLVNGEFKKVSIIDG